MKNYSPAIARFSQSAYQSLARSVRSLFVLKPFPYFRWALILIVVAAAFFRFYLLRTYMHFDYDEALHTQTIYNMVTHFDFIAKGPPVSDSSGLYHGAFYYYLYAIPALFSGGSPLVLGAFTALMSIGAVYFLMKASEEYWGKSVALLAGIIAAVSYMSIVYGRWIWNPNAIPFFTALSLFALVRLSKGKERYLILFTFAVAAISQLHAGGMLFVPIYLLLVPFLLRITRDKKIWMWAIIAGLIPWFPTICQELKGNFQLIRGLLNIFSNPSDVPFWQHMERGYNYARFMFTTTTQLPNLLFVPLAVSAVVGLGYALTRIRKERSRVVEVYVLFIALVSFFVYSYYPGILYIHLSEQLFTLYPLLIALFLAQLLKNWHTGLVTVVAIGMMLQLNLALFSQDILHGDRQYSTYTAICQRVANDGITQAEIIVNKKVNYLPVMYICDHSFDIVPGSQAQYTVTTNLRDVLIIERTY